jgi:hypothetical protein
MHFTFQNCPLTHVPSYFTCPFLFHVQHMKIVLVFMISLVLFLFVWLFLLVSFFFLSFIFPIFYFHRTHREGSQRKKNRERGRHKRAYHGESSCWVWPSKWEFLVSYFFFFSSIEPREIKRGSLGCWKLRETKNLGCCKKKQGSLLFKFMQLQSLLRFLICCNWINIPTATHSNFLYFQV